MRYRRITVPGATYFFTLVTYGRTPLLSDADNVTRWHRALAKVRHVRPFELDAEVILPDHMHMLWTLPEGDADYATRIRLIKSAFTKDIGNIAGSSPVHASRARKGEREVWQRRYWEHLIRDERDFSDHLDYIHINPVKHGLVKRPGDWPHSTFHAWLARGAYEAHWGSDELPELPEWFKRSGRGET